MFIPLSVHKSTNLNCQAQTILLQFAEYLAGSHIVKKALFLIDIQIHFLSPLNFDIISILYSSNSRL
jgi:hypothetical protein